MTHQQLRELMHERVADLTMPDLSAGAWRAGRRLRRRQRLGVVTGVVVATAGVTAGIAVLDSNAPDPRRPPQPATQLPASTEPHAVHQGVPVWWSPDHVEERSLPYVEESSLPQEVGPDVIRSMSASIQGPAIAAFGSGDEVFLLGANGEGGASVVDVSHLDDVARENGYRVSPVTSSMLSPDGWRLVFPQDGEIVLYDIATGEWSGFSAGDHLTTYVTWSGNQLVLPPSAMGGVAPEFSVEGREIGTVRVDPLAPAFDVTMTQSYGRSVVRTVTGYQEAQSWGMGVPLPDRGSDYNPSPEFLVAEMSGRQAVLGFTDRLGSGEDTRFKHCCPVAGWLDGQTVVYESRQTQPLLVAWTVGTDEFRLVSRISGQYDVASFANLER